MDTHSSQSTLMRSLSQSVPPIFQYSFLCTLLLPLLNDKDVLSRLNILCRYAKQWIGKYTVMKSVPYQQALKLFYYDEMSHLIIQRIHDATSTDLEDFPDVHSLQFHATFDRPIPIGSLSNRLETISFGSTFDQPIAVGALPSSLKSIRFGEMFDQPLVRGAIPSTVTQLDFDQHCILSEPLVPGSLPSSLKQLDLHTYIHPLIPGVIPHGVQKVSLYGEFVYPFVTGMFPESVLEIGLPGSPLAHGFCSDVLPSNLQSMTINEMNEPLLVDSFPDSLTKLVIGDEYIHDIPLGFFPPNLTDLKLECPIHQTLAPGFFSDKLRYLQLIAFNTPILPGVLPMSLTHLLLGPNFNQPLQPGSFPSSLLHLELGPQFKQPLLPGVLPPNLVKLSLGRDFSHPIPRGAIPSSVKHVRVSHTLLFAWLPSTVTHLTLDSEKAYGYLQQLIPGTIPDHITHLTLKSRVSPKFPLLPGIIPASVTHVSFLASQHPKSYKEEMDLNAVIPNTVMCLTLSFPLEAMPKHIQAKIVVGRPVHGPNFYEASDSDSFVFPWHNVRSDIDL